MLIELSEQEVRALLALKVPHHDWALADARYRLEGALDQDDRVKEFLDSWTGDPGASPNDPIDPVDALYPVAFAVPRRRWWHWHIKKGK
jgi:hypothetical protein